MARHGMMRHEMMRHEMMHHGMMHGAGMEPAAESTGAAESSAPEPAVPVTAAPEPAAPEPVLPGSFAAALETADAARGQQLTRAHGCIGCHALDESMRTVGPTWDDLADTAARRVAGQGAAEYLYTSIVRPNTYVVPGYRPNVMVQSYGRQLGEQDLADIVKYLLALEE
jgi:cytochrome c551/c552